MKFCKVCQNMLYVNIHGQNMDNLKYTCKNCNYTEKIQDSSSSQPVLTKRYDKTSKTSEQDEKCIMHTNYFDDIRSFQQYQTKNIKYDMTLPRVNNIPCPNCEKKKESKIGVEWKEPEVICVRYDQSNMRYLYFCCHCEHFWKLH